MIGVIGNRSEKTYGNITVIQRSDYKWGVVNEKGQEVVSFGKYAWIDAFDSGLARVRTEGRIYTKNTIAIMDLELNTIISDPNEIATLEKKNRKEHPESYAKWGIINEKGEEVLPVKYDNIWKFAGKNRYSTRVEKDGLSLNVYLHDLNPALPIHCKMRYSNFDGNEYDNHGSCDDYYMQYGTHYGDFAGTWAQDVEGFSDDVIYDAFDGEPDAYWNID